MSEAEKATARLAENLHFSPGDVKKKDLVLLDGGEPRGYLSLQPKSTIGTVPGPERAFIIVGVLDTSVEA